MIYSNTLKSAAEESIFLFEYRQRKPNLLTQAARATLVAGNRAVILNFLYLPISYIFARFRGVCQFNLKAFF